jgi:integrase
LNDVLDVVLTKKGITDGKPTFQELLLVVYKEAQKRFDSGKLKTAKSLRRCEILYLDVLTYFESLYNSSAIKLETISYYDVSKMIDYYSTVKGFEPETIRKRVEFGQRAYEIARQQKLHEHNPFHGHRLPRAKNYRENHITEDELRALMIYNFNSSTFIEVRDFFVFQCFTGLNYGDFKALKRSDLQESKRGLAIIQNRGKTGVQTFIPLLPEAISILKKYHLSETEYCFNVPTLQHYNRILKEVAAIVGINKPLTTKFARKTICNLAFDKGMDVESLGLIVGHKTARTTHKYYISSQAPNRAFTAMENLQSKLK